MYTRQSSRGRGDGMRYTPPPGYMGSAFAAEPDVKHHAPEVDAPSARPMRAMMRDTPESIAENPPSESPPHPSHAPLLSLLDSLRGKIGQEELLILLIMLLAASNGGGVEALILAVALLAA